MTSSSSKSRSNKFSNANANAPVLPLTFSFTRSTPRAPSHSSDPTSLASLPSSFSLSSSSSPSPSPSSSFHRASSPTRVTIAPSNPFRISLNNRSLSPTSRASVSRVPVLPSKFPAKKTCMCSPTSHPGSFRCAIHRKNTIRNGNNSNSNSSISCSPMRLNLRRSAMTNSLVRIGTVEGDWVKRALTALIRPSSHQQRRRGEFRPRPSRLSVMSKADIHAHNADLDLD